MQGYNASRRQSEFQQDDICGILRSDYELQKRSEVGHCDLMQNMNALKIELLW